MIQLPASYTDYLSGKEPRFVEAVLPVCEQSAAEQLHGVHVRIISGGNQAFVDGDLSYGEIVEGID